MSLLGWARTVLTFGANMFSVFKGGVPKPTISNLLPLVVSQLLPMVARAVEYDKLDSKAKIDSWLDSLDASTGTDAGAVDLIRDLPAEQEEAFFDHLKEAARIYAYCLAKVPGYTQP